MEKTDSKWEQTEIYVARRISANIEHRRKSKYTTYILYTQVHVYIRTLVIHVYACHLSSLKDIFEHTCVTTYTNMQLTKHC